MTLPAWNILLVEDDEDDFILTRHMLAEARQGKFSLDWASSFQAGIEKLRTCQYNAVLTDYDLGAYSGIDLIRQAAQENLTTPIIIITGRGSYEIDLEAMQAGAADYISKADLTGTLLEKTIRYTIEHHETKNQLQLANVQLRAERDLLQAVLKSIPDEIWICDAGGTITMVNDRAVEGVGFENQAEVLQNVDQLQSRLDILSLDGSPRPPANQPLLEALQGHSRHTEEMLRNKQTGELRHRQVNASPVLSWEGQVMGAVATVRDVTDQNRLAREVARQAELLRTIFDTIPVMLTIYQPSGQVDQINRETENLLGWRIDELENIDLMEKIYPDPSYRQQVAAFMQNPDGSWRDLKLTARGGEIIDSTWTNVRLSDDTLIGIGIDIRARKQVEEALRRSEERFRLALANAPISVFTMDKDLRYTWSYNPRWGHQTQEIIGRRDTDLDNVEEIHELQKMKQWVIDNGKGIKGEAKARIAGEWIYYNMAIEPLWENGQLIGLTAAAVDITSLRTLQNRQVDDAAHIEVQHRLIQQREMERLEMARDLHDGPLQELVAFSFQVNEALTAGPGEEQQSRLLMVQKSVHEQIKELRQFCHELRPPTLAPFGLERALRSYVASFQQRHPHLSISQNLMYDGQLLPEDMRLALFRITQELLNNINKHAQATEIFLRFAFDDEQVSLEVRDNGIGFNRPTNWLELARSGHLGLIGMRERVEVLGGKIEIESMPGSGTIIRITVPR